MKEVGQLEVGKKTVWKTPVRRTSAAWLEPAEVDFSGADPLYSLDAEGDATCACKLTTEVASVSLHSDYQ